MTGLTARQEKFVEHYALCGNAAEAARLAGYSAKTARVTGPETLSKPAVKAALQARQAVFQAELGVVAGCRKWPSERDSDGSGAAQSGSDDSRLCPAGEAARIL